MVSQDFCGPCADLVDAAKTSNQSSKSLSLFVVGWHLVKKQSDLDGIVVAINQTECMFYELIVENKVLLIPVPLVRLCDTRMFWVNIILILIISSEIKLKNKFIRSIYLDR